MHKILFVCHGNICRSPMAEFIMKDQVKKLGIDRDFKIDSAAVSTEEIGNNIYPSAYRCLVNHGIINASHHARRITDNDIKDYDLIILMDESNIRYMKYLFGNNLSDKVVLITKYLPGVKEIDDPWYTGRFEEVYNQLDAAIKNLIKILQEKK